MQVYEEYFLLIGKSTVPDRLTILVPCYFLVCLSFASSTVFTKMILPCLLLSEIKSFRLLLQYFVKSPTIASLTL